MSNPAAIGQKNTEKMESALEHLKRDLAGLRTGRASVALFDGVRVDYYGTMTPLKQVASISTPEARLITIQPWEPSLIKEIEKSLAGSGLGITPSNDGKIIRVPLPPLTEQRRIAAILDQDFQIQTRAGLHCAPGAHRSLGTLSVGGTVRASFGPSTTPDDIDRLAAALRSLTGG